MSEVWSPNAKAGRRIRAWCCTRRVSVDRMDYAAHTAFLYRATRHNSTVIRCHKCTHHNHDRQTYCDNCGIALKEEYRMPDSFVNELIDQDNVNILPHLRFVLLCRNTSKDPEGQLDIHGLMSVMKVAGSTASMPIVEVKVKAVIGVFSEDTLQSFRMDYSIETPDARETFIGHSEMGWNGTHYIGTQTIPLEFNVGKPGLYWFKVYSSGKRLGQAPFDIQYSEVISNLTGAVQ